MPNKYYAVVRGHTPGIYTNWKETEQQVKGYPGAIFKGFISLEDAQQFISDSQPVETPTTYLTEPDGDYTLAYTDGSYSQDACGHGVVIITRERKKITAYGRVPLPPTNNVAELYAIYVVLSLVEGDIVLYTDSQYAISCLTAYIHNWRKHGWGQTKNRELIETIYQKMQNRQVTFYHVPAHVGIPLNEEADRLADLGREDYRDLIIHEEVQ